MFGNFEKQEPILVNSSGKIVEKAPIEQTKDENQEENLEAKKEMQEAFYESVSQMAIEEGNVLVGSEDVLSEKTGEQFGMSKKGKIAALCLGMTLFAGSFTGIAEARSNNHISDSVNRGAGRAVEDVFRGAGRGASKGVEKVMMNIFGIETREQRQDRINEERNMQRRMEQSERAYQRERETLEREYGNLQNKVIAEHMAGRKSEEEMNRLLGKLKSIYNEKSQEINNRHGRI